MKKGYHYTISRTDRICLISFVIILLGWELVKQILPSGEKSFTYIAPPSEHSGFKEKKKFSYSPPYTSKKYNYSRQKKYEKRYSSYEEEQEQLPPSAPLPVMTASIDELISMGLSRKVAYNIQKFISAGGIIASNKDILKIYGMDSLQYAKALPHIIFGSYPSTNKPVVELLKNNTSNLIPDKIDLNHTSAEELETLVGIGPVLAGRILKFKESLGGFLHPGQLLECYGLTPETYEKIKDQLEISDSPGKLLINEINLDSLAHPYLNRKMIRLIKAYKYQHGNFHNETDFRKVYPADSTWCNKILPYISFETNKADPGKQKQNKY